MGQGATGSIYPVLIEHLPESDVSPPLRSKEVNGGGKELVTIPSISRVRHRAVGRVAQHNNFLVTQLESRPGNDYVNEAGGVSMEVIGLTRTARSL